MERVAKWARLTSAGACAAGLILAGTTGTAQAKSPRCPGSGVLAGSAKVDVAVTKGKARACNRRTGKSVVVGTKRLGKDGYFVRQVQVAGRFVAVLLQSPAKSSGGPFTPDRLRLYDGVKGRRVALGDTGCAPAFSGGASVIGSFAVGGRGNLAWACVATTQNGYQRAEVHAHDRCGTRLVAQSDAATTSDQINVGSVGLAENFNSVVPYVYWLTTGAAHAAPLASSASSCA